MAGKGDGIINTKMVNLMPAILLIIANVNKHAN